MKNSFALLICFCGLLIGIPDSLPAQGIFSQALADADKGSQQLFSVNGQLRSSLFASPPGTTWTVPSYLADSKLILSTKQLQNAQAFADIRLRTGQLFNNKINDFEIKELWASFSFGLLNIRAGKQIVTWGIADGINPSNHFGIQDYFYQSDDHQDTKLGTWSVSTQLRFSDHLNGQLILQPGYQPSVYRFDLVNLPDLVSITPPLDVHNDLSMGSLGAKIDYTGDLIQASLSYFRGFDPMPGLELMQLPDFSSGEMAIQLGQTAFRQHSVGLTASAVMNQVIVRFEGNYKMPFHSETGLAVVPKKEYHAVAALEGDLGPIKIITQYVVKHIPDFESSIELPPFSSQLLMDPQVLSQLETLFPLYLQEYNNIIFEQQHRWSHALMMVARTSMFQDKLSIELSSLYNFTTKEYLVYPAIALTAIDRVSLHAGYQHYYGPKNTRFDWISAVLSGPYVSLRISF